MGVKRSVAAVGVGRRVCDRWVSYHRRGRRFAMASGGACLSPRAAIADAIAILVDWALWRWSENSLLRQFRESRAEYLLELQQVVNHPFADFVVLVFVVNAALSYD